MRAILSVLMWLVAGAAAFADEPKVGIAWPDTDMYGGPQSRLELDALVAELGKRSLAYEWGEARDEQYQIAQVESLIAKGIKVLVIRPLGPSVEPTLRKAREAGVRIVSVDRSWVVSAPADIAAGYDIAAAAPLFKEAIGDTANQSLAILAGAEFDGVKGPELKDLIGAFSKVAADCGGCPKTGECPKSAVNAENDCPCPKTGECPKSVLEDFLRKHESMTVVTLDNRMDEILQGIGKQFAGHRVIFGQVGGIDAVKRAAVAGNPVVWGDPKALGSRTADAVVDILAGKDLSRETFLVAPRLLQGDQARDVAKQFDQ